MNALVQEVLDDLSADAGLGRAVIVVEALPPGRADRSLLKQVWVNLLSNALKYSSKRARPRIEIRPLPAAQGAGYLVRDNGVGFDMHYADKLFGVFQRLHAPQEYEGTGIGLATVRHIIGRHGGRVWAEAEVDRGATFYFTLGELPEASAGGTA
jgi:light-regulated signal transduction histidine kinase (bacteriophytochrome)